MTRIKICGITNLEDALICASAGADEIGFNFYSKSPRYISPQAVKNIIGQLPDNVKKVGVFVNESVENVTRIAVETGIDSIQLHGTESPVFVSTLSDQIDLPVIKAFRVSVDFDVNDISNYKKH